MIGVRLLGCSRPIIRATVHLRYPNLHRAFRMSPIPTGTSPALLASIDLSSYDPEQSRLMDERCILVDEQDRAIGAADKKTCVSPSNSYTMLLFKI